MSPMHGGAHVVRRARPLLGTLIEVGLCGTRASDDARTLAACDIAFDAIAIAQACLSRFERGSDIARFNAAAAGTKLRRPPMRRNSGAILGAPPDEINPKFSRLARPESVALHELYERRSRRASFLFCVR